MKDRRSAVDSQQKKGLEFGAGVINSDYRGEVHVLLFKRTTMKIVLPTGERIAQSIVVKNMQGGRH